MINNKSLKNLKSNSERTPKQRAELARKAGIKSGVARKEKANFKRTLEQILESKATGSLITTLNAFGINTSKNQTILESLIQLATIKAMADNTTLIHLVRFLEFARDTLGDNKQENNSQTLIIPSQELIDNVMGKLKEL